MALEDIFTREAVNVGRFTRHLEDWYALISSLGVCGSPDVEEYSSVETLSALYRWTTGIARNSEALKLAAERAWNLMNVMNVMEGFSKSDDRPPDRWF